MPHLSSQRPVPALRRWLPIIAAAVMLLAALVSVGGAQEADQLRGDVPSGAALRQQLADLAERRTSLGEELARLEAELAAAIEDRDGLDGASRQLAIDIEALRSSTRRLAVSSFISGGPGFEMRYLLDLEGASDISRRRHLINTLTDPLDEDSGRLREMESQADADLLVLVDRIEALRREIERIPRELAEVLLAEAEAGSLLVIADAWDRADEAIAEGGLRLRAPREVGGAALLRVVGQLSGGEPKRPIPRGVPVRPAHLADDGRHRRPGRGAARGAGRPGPRALRPARPPALAGVRPPPPLGLLGHPRTPKLSRRLLRSAVSVPGSFSVTPERRSSPRGCCGPPCRCPGASRSPPNAEALQEAVAVRRVGARELLGHPRTPKLSRRLLRSAVSVPGSFSVTPERRSSPSLRRASPGCGRSWPAGRCAG